MSVSHIELEFKIKAAESAIWESNANKKPLENLAEDNVFEKLFEVYAHLENNLANKAFSVGTQDCGKDEYRQDFSVCGGKNVAIYTPNYDRRRSSEFRIEVIRA